MPKVEAKNEVKEEVKVPKPLDETKEIEIKVRHITQTVDGTTSEFDVFKALQRDGRYIDCKFKKEVIGIPTEDCKIVVKLEDINIQKNKKYPCLWVENILEIKPLTKAVKNLQEANDLF